MVNFKKDTAVLVEALFRRVGRPRKQWTQNTFTMIWRKIRDDQSDFKTPARNLLKYCKQLSTKKSSNISY